MSLGVFLRRDAEKPLPPPDRRGGLGLVELLCAGRDACRLRGPSLKSVRTFRSGFLLAREGGVRGLHRAGAAFRCAPRLVQGRRRSLPANAGDHHPTARSDKLAKMSAGWPSADRATKLGGVFAGGSGTPSPYKTELESAWRMTTGC